MRWRRVVLCVLLALVAIDHVRFSVNLLARFLHRANFGRAPFYLDIDAQAKVALPLAEAVKVGLKRGDRILAINGRTGSIAVIEEELARLKPGQTITVRAQTGDEGPREITIPVIELRRDGDLLINVVLECFVLLVCLPLGFGVAFLKPDDIRSWVLLWMMLSFIPSFRLFEFYSKDQFFNLLGYFFAVFLRATWPACMAVLGLSFPDRLRLHGWSRKVVFPVLCLMAGYTVAHALLLFLVFCGRVTYPPLADLLAPVRRATGEVDLLIGMTLIGSYFGLIGFRTGLARTREERRRLVLLNVGSHIAFAPIFVLVLRSIFQRRDIFDGLSIWVSVPTIFVMMLFPLTLAYLVLVHRALDVRVFLRTGLQYALATRAVNVVRVLLIVGASVYIPQLMRGGERRVDQVFVIALIVGFVVLGNKLAIRAKAWMDRRFFREAYNSEQLLSDLSFEMRRMLEPAPLVEMISRRIAESLHVTHIVTLLRNHSGLAAGFVPAFALGYDGPLDTEFPTGDPVARRLAELRIPQRVYLDDQTSWVNRELRGHPDRERLTALQSQLLLPIEGQGELAGFISLGPKRSEEPYSHSDLQLLQSVAAQAGLALENTRLTAAVAHEAAQRERLSQEMEIARHVQERLFPQRRPDIDGIDYAGYCRPAQSVGGDSYDYIDLTNGEFCFSIGDVSGKGVPASILMAVVQTSIRSNAILAASDLAAMMRNVNRIVEESSPKKHFATLFFGQYAPASRQMRYVNAAHNPPLLLRSSGGVEWLRPTGHAIGWSKKAEFRESVITLGDGDLLLLYTDGITEAMNTQQDEFGEERLLAAAQLCHTLHPEAIIPAILHAVDQFAAGEPQHDDMTMVALKVR